ncbi:spore protease YyaC [Tepidibacillus fermentans]|uniref:Putative sporulation protein YyaC n=1 Tax=Tepidibacillus fermentans TaxID=1281767 RepID=A0A4R3KCH8_9BACI|nr:spore protease YyaC [Tepidibacillus fermentans]TCS80808.1 putative sporulation protein YyaC [Tepidibacillus fermentans]
MDFLKFKNPSKYVIDYSNPRGDIQLSHYILNYMDKYSYDHWVVVCIGTDRSTGDALGPLVGSKLKLMEPSHYTVLGTLEEPVHALNLENTIHFIEEQYPYSGILAVDACLGQLGSVGSIQVVDGPLKPGAGVQKNLPEIGHFHISGVVNIGGFMEYFVLQNTRLHVVMKMADMIANSIHQSLRLYGYNKENAAN